MSDLPKRKYAPAGDRLHADAELGLSRIRDSLEALGAGDIAYTPGEPTDWADPKPTDLLDAIDRIVAVVKASHTAP